MNNKLEEKPASVKKVKASEVKKPASVKKVKASEVKKLEKQLIIKLVKSGIGFSSKQKRVIKGLGFSRLNQIITRPDTPQIRGMVFKVKHLLEVTKD